MELINDHFQNHKEFCKAFAEQIAPTLQAVLV